MFAKRQESKEVKENLKEINWKLVPTIKTEGFWGTFPMSLLGEFRRFYIGDALEMSKYFVQLGDLAIKDKSASGGIAHFYIGNVHGIMLANAELNAQLFKHQKSLSRSEALEANFAVGLGQKNVFTIASRTPDKKVNKPWKKQREAILEAVHMQKLSSDDFAIPMAAIVNEVFDDLDAKMKESKQDHLDVNLESVSMRISMLVAVKLLLGVPMDDKEFSKHTDEIATLYTNVLLEAFRFYNEMKYRSRKKSDTTETATEVERKKLVDALKKYFIDPYQKNILATDNVLRKVAALDPANAGKEFKDFTLDTPDIYDAISFLILVSHDTTSRSIQFMIMYYAQVEELQKKILAEIKEAEPSDGVWTPKYVKQALPLLNAGFKEGGRLHPGAPILMYKVLEKIILNGGDLGQIKYKKDDIAIVSIWHTHRAENYYEDPLNFHYDRFLKEDASIKPNSGNPKFAPFSYGERSCPAYEYASFEAIVAVIDWMKRYEFTVDKKPPFACDMLGTLRHSGDVMARISPRKQELGVKLKI